MPRKKASKPSLKMKRLAANLRKGLPVGVAGKLAGYSDPAATSRAYKTIRLRFHPALEASGYNINEELNLIYSKIREKTEARETLFFQKDGIVMETRQVVAHDIQLRAANDLARLIGASGNGHDNTNGDEGIRVPHVVVQVAITGTGDSARALEVRPANPADHQQSVLDVESHEDERRPGPEPTL